MKRIVGILLLLATAGASPALAGIENAGTSAANFLTLGAGPAVLAMGGAALGRGGSLDLAAWNPAALGFVNETTLQFSHATLDDQAMQEWATMGGRFGHGGTRWATSALFQSEGVFESRDASNTLTGTFGVASAAGVVEFAQAFGPNVAVGVAGKYILDNLGPAERGSGMTADAGISMRFGAVGFGAAAQNVGGAMTYSDGPYPFPTSYGAGVSYTHAVSGMTAACDVNVPSTSYTNVRAGVEWNWKHLCALRGGYRMEMGAPADDALSGPSFGAGLGARGVWFDYGYLLSGNEGGQHRLAISLNPSHFGWAKPGDPFGQSSIPREFDNTTLDGPPAPPPAKATKKK